VVDGTQAACGACHGTPPPSPHPNVTLPQPPSPVGTSCHLCHPGTVKPDGTIDVAGGRHIDGILQVTGGRCGSCHGVPPATGSHLVHFAASTADATYGGLEITSDLMPGGDGYAFNCGNCHPLDLARHGNGVPNAGGGAAEIDLSPLGAPAASLKARNGPGARYTPGPAIFSDYKGLTYTEGTCSEVYCHSARTVETPDPVPAPGVDFDFEGYPITYPTYTVNVGRAYRDVTWGDSLSCDGCHGFPPRTYDATVIAGAGDSHSFIDKICTALPTGRTLSRALRATTTW